ncbi:MAG: hypothetical protein QOH91_1197 [Mycobacterium sp.]|jgi:hypothetical protein|nr:hypothetical protein [Mycobacterium sp.]
MTIDAATHDTTITPQLRQQIEALSIEYAWLIDHGHAERAAELFTEDATLDTGVALHGIAAIRDALTKRAALDIRSRHVVSNVRLVGQAADRVRGTVLMTVYRRTDHQGEEPEVFIIAEADDLYRLGADGRWRFAQRLAAPIFVRSSD